MNFINCKAVKDGSDVKLEFGTYSVKLPEGKAEKLVEGGYIDKDVIMGIRPEDIKDEEIYVNNGTDNVLEATVKVYEMLGAEVFLYFTVEGFDITVRVNPRTTARPMGIQSRLRLTQARFMYSTRKQRKLLQTSFKRMLCILNIQFYLKNRHDFVTVLLDVNFMIYIFTGKVVLLKCTIFSMMIW